MTDKDITKKDQQLAQIIKQQAHQPGENPWFTRRVLGKLPARSPRHSHAPVLLMALALVLCVAGMAALVWHQDFTVITVRDVLSLALTSALTLVVLWQGIVALMRAAD